MISQLGGLASSAENVTCEAASGLRFAVVCANLKWQPWQYWAVKLLALEGCGRLIEVVHLVTAYTKGGALGTTRGVADRSIRLREANFDLAVGVVECLGVESIGGWQLDDNGVAKIRALNLDFLLVFGIERLRGDVLDATRYGVWAFATFWPVSNDEDVTTVAVVRLAPTIGEDTVLRWATLGTLHTYRATFSAVSNTVSSWPASIASELVAGCPLASKRFRADEWTCAVKSPSTSQRWRSVVSQFRRLTRRVAHFAFCFDVWHIGLARTDLRGVLENALPPNITWAPTPGFGRFYADPMVLDTATGMKVFCERYSYWEGKGDICALQYAPDEGWLPNVESVISEPFHLSYPTIVEMEHGKFCVPESCEAGVTYAYPVAADGKIEQQRTVFVGFEVADPTMVEHQGNWYLFGAVAAEARYALRIWFAKAREGPWTPHPANPVKCDVHTARSAGPFFHIDGRLYRPSQNSAKGYGASINIMEVIELSPTAFREVIARSIEPNARWPYSQGVHTMTSTRYGVLVDAKVVCVSPLAPILRIVNLIQGWRRRRQLAKRKP
jgi:hypothetical protein